MLRTDILRYFLSMCSQFRGVSFVFIVLWIVPSWCSCASLCSWVDYNINRKLTNCSKRLGKRRNVRRKNLSVNCNDIAFARSESNGMGWDEAHVVRVLICVLFLLIDVCHCLFWWPFSFWLLSVVQAHGLHTTLTHYFLRVLSYVRVCWIVMC